MAKRDHDGGLKLAPCLCRLTGLGQSNSFGSALARIVRGALVSASLGLFGASFAADEIHWTITGPTSVTFDWRGDAAESSIAYGLEAGSYTESATAANPSGVCVPFSSAGPFWEAKLTGLSPNTVYHYAIAGGPDHTFRTPPAAGTSPFEVLVQGDIGDSTYYPHMAEVQQLIAQEQNARFALVVGDLSYGDDHGVSHADDHFNDVMTWSQDLAYMPAWGNHEWDSEPADDLRNYKGRFDFPNAQTAAGTPPVSDCGEDWYWFDYGNARFIAYPEPWTGAWADWNTKATLIMNEAQEDPNISWIVTFGHRPAYSSGYHAGNTKLQDYLNELAASHSKYVLNLNGHSHNYERTFPQNGSGDNLHGAVHVTVGTGGATLESDGPCLWTTCTQPSWSAVRYFHLGYLKLSFTSSSVEGAFVCGPAGSGANDVTCTPGSVIDAFSILPNGPYPTIYVDQADPLCSATGSGTPAQPFCTITQGVNRAVAGNTVIVKTGTYHEYVKVTKSGTSAQPILIMAEPGANVVVSGQFRGFELLDRNWVTIQGFTVSDTSSYGIYAANSTHIVIANNRVTRAGQPIDTLARVGIELSNTTDSIVSGNTTDHNTDAGIALLNGTTRVTVTGNLSFSNARGYTRAAPGIDVRSGGNTLVGNFVHHNEDSGIQIMASGGAPSPNNLVVNNVCYENADHGIDVSSAGSQRIIGNTVYRNGTAGINLEGPSSGSTLENNISVDNAIGSTGTKGNICVDPASVPGTTIDHDLVYLSAAAPTIVWNSVSYSTLAAFVAATGKEAHGLEGAPQWVAPAAGNFRLLATSPAIDAANSGTSGASDTDIEGSPRVDEPAVPNAGAGPRPFDDIGAYEHPLCGNGIVEPGEDCDGTETGIAVCGQQGCGGGDPSCTEQCTLSYATCTDCPVCGNGVKEFGEDCDGGDLAGASCESLGQCSIGGGLACASDCRFNTASCTCGDGTVQGGCGEACDGANLAGETCASQGFPAGGVLSCRTNCAGFETALCNVCGDGVRQPAEACDGNDLGGATCSSQGCFAGAPTCSGSCGLDFSSCSNCWAGVLYVDQANPACSNAGQGTAAAPFCTINGAAARVVSGGTVIVAAGTYSEYVKVLSSGTAAAPIVFKAAPGATVNVTGQVRGFEISGKSWITIEGFNVSSTVQYGIYVTNSSNVTIRNNRVAHTGAPSLGNTFAGISISGSTNVLVSGNTTEENSDSGIYVNSGNTNVTIEGNVSARNARGYVRAASGIEIRSGGHVVRGNICHDNEDAGIAVKPFASGVPSPNTLIVNNVTYGNAGRGISVSASGSQRIVGNTVYGNLGAGIDLAGASTQCVVANNISADNALGVSGSAGGNLRVEAAAISGTTLDHDLLYRSSPGTMVSWAGTAYTSLAAFAAATGKELHGLQSAPLWVSPGTADFRLTIGSPAVDSADSGVSGAQATDATGTARTDDPATSNTGDGPRAYDDRGAYEYPLDADHDGYASNEDCNDMNSAVFPAALDDSCDGVDNDCSGQADEDFIPLPTTCGVGACTAAGQYACVNGVLANTCTPGTPAASDATCDGIDDDCSGQSDEDYVATPTTCGVGACAATGQSACVNGAVADTCTPGTPGASDASCDGIDDDCNGEADEDFVSTPTTCGVGTCVAAGQSSCVNGAVADTCTPGTPAASDATCDGIDEDCSGQADEDYPATPTTCGVGACAATGQSACVNGAVADTCTAGTPAASDGTCDGIDDDCNGEMDEDFVSTPTSCGLGACVAAGQSSCVNGAVADTCTPGTPAASDATCDGIDEDCSGQADEDYSATPTTCGIGACAAAGQSACVNGAVADTCTAGTPAASDGTCDGIDDDCNGETDEDFVSTPTSCGLGACVAAGQSSCVNGAVADTCTPGTPAASDATCDGIDEDCSGQADEDYPATPTTCGIGACAASGQSACVNGAVSDTCTPGTPAASDATCDGFDDDCNGETDEDFVSTPTTCGVGACVAAGQSACVNGVPTNVCSPGTPVPEVGCDGVDNDCDPGTPDVRDGDGDTATCAVDCNDSDASIYPGAVEINDGNDNQCPGNAGYGLVDETSGDSGFHTLGLKSKYSWQSQSGATSYDVSRASSRDFTTGCLATQTADSEWMDTELPSPGTVFYYVNRPVAPFTGSWGARSSGAQRTVSCSAL